MEEFNNKKIEYNSTSNVHNLYLVFLINVIGAN